MTEREKVIKEIARIRDEYFGEMTSYEGDALDAALALLKAQQPRMMTLEEMKALKEYTIVWYENINTECALPRIVNYVNDYGVHFTDGAVWRFDADRYGSVWRCWTSRPTDGQREAEPWEN